MESRLGLGMLLLKRPPKVKKKRKKRWEWWWKVRKFRDPTKVGEAWSQFTLKSNSKVGLLCWLFLCVLEQCNNFQIQEQPWQSPNFEKTMNVTNAWWMGKVHCIRTRKLHILAFCWLHWPRYTFTRLLSNFSYQFFI